MLNYLKTEVIWKGKNFNYG